MGESCAMAPLSGPYLWQGSSCAPRPPTRSIGKANSEGDKCNLSKAGATGCGEGHTYLVHGRFGIALPKPLYEMLWWLHLLGSVRGLRSSHATGSPSLSDLCNLVCNNERHPSPHGPISSVSQGLQCHCEQTSHSTAPSRARPSPDTIQVLAVIGSHTSGRRGAWRSSMAVCAAGKAAVGR